MGFWNRIILVVKQLKNQLTISVILILGIGIGIAIITTAIGLNSGYQNFLRRSYQRSEMLKVSFQDDNQELTLPARRIKHNQLTTQAFDLSVIDNLKKDVSQIDFVWASSSLNMSINGEQPPIHLDGEEFFEWLRKNCVDIHRVTPDFFKVYQIKLEQGSLLTKQDLADRNSVIILGKGLVHRFLPGIDPIGEKVTIQGQSYTVIGVVIPEMGEPTSKGFHTIDEQGIMNGAFIPYSLRLFDREPGVTQLFIKVKPTADFRKTQQEIKNYLFDRYGQYVYVTSDFYSNMKEINMVIKWSYGMGIFALIVLVISSINIMNMMLAKVTERTRWIGISRVLGANIGEIFKTILMETTLISTMGGIIGIFLSIISLHICKNYISIIFPIVSIFWGLVISFIVNMILGLFPAFQAIKVQVIDAIRVE